MIVNIVGGGPAGSYLAYLLAKEGAEVRVFEEHKQIGEPIQCTGVVTKDLFEFIPRSKQFVTNKINKAAVFYNHEKIIDFKVENYVIDRSRFDKFMAEMAKKEGAKYFLAHSYVSGGAREIKVKNRSKIKKFEGDVLVGADGPLSAVAKHNKIKSKKRTFYFGIQAVVKKRNNDHTYNAHFGKVAPKFYAWQVPQNKNTYLIGLGTLKNTKKHFNDFLKELNINPKKVKIQAGLIPMYDFRAPIRKGRVFILGDAAAQSKASTGGGLIPAFRFAKKLKNAIMRKKSYKNWDKDLWQSLKFRQALNHMTEKDYKLLLRIMSRKKMRNLIEKLDRDNAFKLWLKASILVDPRLWWYPIKFLRRIIGSRLS